MKKRCLLLIAMLALIIITFAGCAGVPSDKAYAKTLDESGLFANKRADAIAQTEIAKKVKAHVESGSNKKALYIAFDGSRADLLFNISKHPDREKYPYAEESIASGINLIKKTGGLYLAYAGGDVNNKDTLQEASTIPGFSTLLSGKWANEHKVYTNNSGFDRVGDTILMELAKQKKKVSFNARWSAYFDCLFKKEFDQDLPNYISRQSETDLETYQNMLNGIDRSHDLVFGIFDDVDSSGHSQTFGNQTPAYVKAFVDVDMYAYNLAKAALARENEDWLVVITTDHGGHQWRHGTTKFTDTTTFIACNKKVFE